MKNRPDSLAPLKENLKMRLQSGLKNWLQKFEGAQYTPETEENLEGFVQGSFRGAHQFQDIPLHKFIFDRCGRKFLLCINKDPTGDEQHQSSKSALI